MIELLIGFVCGYLCRQVIWLEQKRNAKIRYVRETKEFLEQMDKIKAELKQQIKDINK